MANYYDILGVSATSSREELKKSYHNLAREHHPDKSSTAQVSTAFHLIDEAWKVLGDDQLRKKYDAKLKASEMESSHPVQEEIKLSDTVHNSTLNQFEKDCRCGGSYVLSESDICDELLLIDCDNCSLSIVIDCDIDNFHNKGIGS